MRYKCWRALKEAVHEQTIAFNRWFTVHLTLVHEKWTGSCRTLLKFLFLSKNCRLPGIKYIIIYMSCTTSSWIRFILYQIYVTWLIWSLVRLFELNHAFHSNDIVHRNKNKKKVRNYQRRWWKGESIWL